MSCRRNQSVGVVYNKALKGPHHAKMYLWAYADSEDLDQPVSPCCLIRACYPQTVSLQDDVNQYIFRMLEVQGVRVGVL